GPIRRVFAFGSGTGMLSAEGDAWRRHRQMLNPVLDHRAVMADVPMLIALAEELADHLARVPAGKPVNLTEVFTHLLTRATGRVFAGDDRAIEPIVQHMGHYPGKYSALDFLPLPRWSPPAAATPMPAAATSCGGWPRPATAAPASG